MKAILQRVSHAAVEVAGERIGEIGRGLLILLGVAAGDPPGAEELLARKAAGLRIFRDDGGKMNLSVVDIGGAVLVVSQFTLLADCRKGRRPSFTDAAPPAEADTRYEKFCTLLRDQGLQVETGRFGADMQVSLLNSGPVTIVLDSEALGAPRSS
ncbi:MAG: D-tyrosyl-tRNA(Tyr) deacylase [Planctomycetes bacterium]|nr:D-tyrosyl-tRNA(Tyr) deacylase [Planctomycetota bacterium]